MSSKIYVYCVMRDEYCHGDWDSVLDSLYKNKADAQAYIDSKDEPQYFDIEVMELK